MSEEAAKSRALGHQKGYTPCCLKAALSNVPHAVMLQKQLLYWPRVIICVALHEAPGFDGMHACSAVYIIIMTWPVLTSMQMSNCSAAFGSCRISGLHQDRNHLLKLCTSFSQCTAVLVEALHPALSSELHLQAPQGLPPVQPSCCRLQLPGASPLQCCTLGV